MPDDKLIGALTIGQSPRLDLVDPLRGHLPDDCRIIEVGALDGLTTAAIPPMGERIESIYPLTTRLRDGALVVVEEAFLLPRLQQALDYLENEGAVASILLCAGSFTHLQGARPLFKPFAVGSLLLRALGLSSLGLIAPIVGQVAPIQRRWQAAGFTATVWTADINQQDQTFQRQLAAQIKRSDLQCIVLDYVGHPAQSVAQLQRHCPLPVIDLGRLAMSALGAAL